MKLYNPVKVFDLDDFLPLDGEDDFKINYLNNNLNLDIYFENEDLEEVYKRIQFFKVKHFFKSPFPGTSFFSCPDDSNVSLLSCLVEYEKSELIDKDLEFSSSKNYKHYRLFLHSCGAAIYVIAEDCKLVV